MMKVLVLAPHFPYPHNTGAKTRTYNILKRLAGQHDVTFACMTRDRVASDHLDHLHALCSAAYVAQEPGARPWRKVGWLAGSRPYHASMFWSPRLRDMVQALLAQNRYDVVYCNFLYTAQYLPESTRAAPLVAVDQHNADHLVWQDMRAKDPNPLIRLMATRNLAATRRYEDRQYPKFDLCFSVSEEDAEATRRIAPPDLSIRVAPNGVDTSRFVPQLELEPARRTLLFFGGMNARMNRDAVLYLMEDILPLVRERVPDVCMNIVGPNPPPAVRRLGASPGVTVVGEVPDVRPYIASCTLVVAPVRMGGGTKVKVLESMAMGKAVVATAHACQGLDVQDGRDVAVADSAEAIAEKVVWLLGDEQARRRIGAAARLTVEHSYSWEAIAESIMGELTSALEEKKKALAPSGLGAT